MIVRLALVIRRGLPANAATIRAPTARLIVGGKATVITASRAHLPNAYFILRGMGGDLFPGVPPADAPHLVPQEALAHPFTIAMTMAF
ncbi:hypothetical protein LGH82_17500 [Mesorhizobium sp. PAMC28654]|uniref:hypothetical protein n=1 Tax=Mesorhizobium sp. PAMC28654 TaxID=2880934 RepID=UPI001D09BCF5|nr:hypothetical protein [Mesorhizobium sp. PAMC28654]UDL87014.1 hypothetical protein LGH82_17500 [Mesorhizobium sp. PAMC28654]